MTVMDSGRLGASAIKDLNMNKAIITVHKILFFTEQNYPSKRSQYQPDRTFLIRKKDPDKCGDGCAKNKELGGQILWVTKQKK